MNNPATLLDPDGQKVFLRCWPVKKYGVTWGRHCSVIVYCDGKALRIDGGGERSIGQDPEYPDRPTPTITETQEPITPGAGEVDYDLDSPWKSCQNEWKCIKNAYDRILQLPYSRMGPNSNTYAHAVIRVCSISFPCRSEVIWVPVVAPSHMGACHRGPSTVRICAPDGAAGWTSSGYGSTVEGGPEPDWK
jgi:hypothetical protein